MPTTAPLLPPIPTPNVPIIDEQTGLVNRDWYRWLKFLEQILRQVRSEIP